MAKVRTPREAWIEGALKALASGGPDAVRVESLATTLGVTKGGFYWHFDNRGALLDEALDAWEKESTEDVISLIEGEAGDPRTRLRRLFDLAPSAAQGPFAVELALRDWSRRDEAVAGRLRRIDGRRMDFLRSQFREFCVDDDDADARSLLAYSLLIGSYFVDGRHGGRSRSEVVGLAIDRLLDDEQT